MTPTLKIENGVKKFRSDGHNYDFDLNTGHAKRWGKTEDENPEFAPLSPEICDIEISYGDTCKIKCNFCYKGNGINGLGVNMSLETFKSVFEKFPKVETSNIEFENGKVIVLSKNIRVLLKDGKIKLVSELKENDDILKFY